MIIEVKKEEVLSYIEQRIGFIERKNYKSKSDLELRDIDFMLGILFACFKFDLIDLKELFRYVDRL